MPPINPKSKRPVTQSEIAAKSGVSQSAVSAILSGKTGLNVSVETHAKVLAVAEELGYVHRKAPASKAPAAAARRSALLVEETPTNEKPSEWVADGYQNLLGNIVSGVGRSLASRGMGMSVHYRSENPRDVMQWLTESDIAGVIWHASERDHALLHWVASRYPMVLINREWGAAVPFDSVSIDQGRNVVVAAEHLWEAGHRRIAMFGHCPTNSIFSRRVAAYRSYVAERGLRDYAEFRQLNDDQNYPADQKVDNIIRLWRDLGEEAPTALIMSDVFALRLLGVAGREGIDIPGQLSVVGIDNTAACSLMHPGLSSMNQPFDEMCREAADLLARRINEPDKPSHFLQIAPRLVARGSVRQLVSSGVGGSTSISLHSTSI